MQFDFSNWNYSFAKNTDPDRYADNCADMGLTIAMLPRTDYDSEAEGLRIMDALHARGIRVIVKDGRTSWAPEKDPGIYREDILATKRAFNEHPAFWCHCVRDEPYPKEFAPLGDMLDIMRENDCPAFVNHHPFYALFKKTFGARENYVGYLAEYTVRHGLPLVAYDRYTHMYDEKIMSPEECAWGLEEFYLDLNAYRAAAAGAGVPAWVTMLCTGHMMYRNPTYEDILFQITTAIAHGYSCVQWFYPFAHGYSENNYGCPVDSYGERTEIFGYIARATRIVKDHLLEPLKGYTFAGVRHFGRSYGGTKEYVGEYGFGVESIWHGSGIIAEFSRGTDRKYLLVNNSDHADRFRVTYPDSRQDYFAHMPRGGFHFVHAFDATKAAEQV